MADTKVQRIKLRCEGSPVKYDGTILAADPVTGEIKVQFDAPVDDKILVPISDRHLASDMEDKDGNPTTDWRMAVQSLVWEVL
jgi:hypothetical protein